MSSVHGSNLSEPGPDCILNRTEGSVRSSASWPEPDHRSGSGFNQSGQRTGLNRTLAPLVEMEVLKWRRTGLTSGEEGQPLLLVSRRMSWTCHGHSQYIYIYKRHAGAPFAPALLSLLLYLVGTNVTELVVVMLCFVVARWKGGDTDTTERVNPFCRVGSFYVAGDMARLWRRLVTTDLDIKIYIFGGIGTTAHPPVVVVVSCCPGIVQ